MVSPILIGVLAPSTEEPYVQEMCSKLRKVAPDRTEIRTMLMTEDAVVETEGESVHVLILCASRPNFPQSLAQK